MALKFKDKSIKVEFDSESYVFEFDGLKHHKITSRRFPVLLGENKFNSVGYQILEMFKLLEREEIEEWYTLRGAVAEHFADEYLKGGFYENTRFQTVTFAPQQFKGYDQFNGKSDKYGGVIDIAILKPQRMVCEVKSKSLDKMSFIHKARPQEEVSQGEQLAYLSVVGKYLMIYVFFTPEQEEKLQKMAENIVKSGLKVGDIVYKQMNFVLKGLGFELKDLVINIYPYELNRERTKQRMLEAYKVFEMAKKTNKIKKSLFNPEEQAYLDKLVTYKEKLDGDELIKMFLNNEKKGV